jgi:hypothetical protein
MHLSINIIFIIRYQKFKELIFDSYQVLRKNVDGLVTLLRMMLCCGLEELTEKSISIY